MGNVVKKYRTLKFTEKELQDIIVGLNYAESYFTEVVSVRHPQKGKLYASQYEKLGRKIIQRKFDVE